MNILFLFCRLQENQNRRQHKRHGYVDENDTCKIQFHKYTIASIFLVRSFT